MSTPDFSKPAPQIVFQVNLARLSQEKMGPITNQTSVTVLTPDMYCNAESNDPASGGIAAARAATATRDAQKISWLPGDLAAENINHANGYQFVAYGQRALYLQKTYADTTKPDLNWLTVVQYNNPPIVDTTDPGV